MSIAVIKPHEVAELNRKGQKIDLIDVRTPVRFREVHVDFAWSFPLDQLDPAALMQTRNGSVDEPEFRLCHQQRLAAAKREAVTQICPPPNVNRNSDAQT